MSVEYIDIIFSFMRQAWSKILGGKFRCLGGSFARIIVLSDMTVVRRDGY